MKKLRDYQTKANKNVRAQWAAGNRAVCLVAPTGSGKTVMGSSLVPGGRVLWVAHRRELVHQAAKQLDAQHVGEVGIIMHGASENKKARIQVASTATILSRGVKSFGKFDAIVFDECHHYEADTYREIRKRLPESLCVGLTATPQRDDGRPLGDTFDALVVAAQYSELIRDGHIIAPTVFRPPVDLGSDKAADPTQALMSYVGKARTIAFYPRVAEAKASIRSWHQAGIRADHLDGDTPKAIRDEAVEAFTVGRIDLITNVYVLTEGVDIPAAECVLSARKFEFVGTMIQAFGRAMRKAPGKKRAFVIDLCGSTVRHGLPHDDREYDLNSDRPIKRKSIGDDNQERLSPLFMSEVVDVPLEMVAAGSSVGVPAEPIAGMAAPKPLPVTLRGAKLKLLRAKHGPSAARLAEEYWRQQTDV